ncbi:hypothetical protein EUTSA_v10021356mg [Eutrema salsugineum]|uniref:TF-B3 domain-containing protein n=1 Tax=Eutrema salsugineum TaxID=72664 RepID=V4LWD5_EUTSA|nr:B3 domain-containing protein At5g25470 [Eutrema salsugineum]XP_024015560.1 B3 domain-containing protein At5g25470 [Eutrema salsugineum]ESQ48124.1 hypothetical protein EUTSA_v10021356mg [Eutrema salsugineum]
MLPKSENQSKPSFSKSLSLGQNWKSKSMRMIPEEFVRSIKHRLVFSVHWGNSWQLWLQGDKKGLFMVKEDWDEFVDDNLLGPDDTLLFTHQDTMHFQVRIFKKDGKEINSVPLEVETGTEPFHPKPRNSLQEATPGKRRPGRAGKNCSDVENLKRYLVNPQNPFFKKTLTKTNHILYVSSWVIEKYGLEFAPHNSEMYFHLPHGTKHKGFTKFYGRSHGFNGWEEVSERYNLKVGDSVVCELELSGGVVAAVRVHFLNE